MVSLELEARLDNLLSTAQAETVDIDIFAPINITEREECPLCLIALPILNKDIQFMACCGKRLCDGCIHKHLETEKDNGVLKKDIKCAFCRRNMLSTAKDETKAIKKLIKKSDDYHVFMQMAGRYESGNGVLQSDTKALEMRIRAAELGYAGAYLEIGHWYLDTPNPDLSKLMAFYKVAAKKGSTLAHEVIAEFYDSTGNVQMYIQHMKIAASAGYKEAMDKLMKAYKDKNLSKEELAQTLRAFQASCIEMKSKDRDDSKAFSESRSHESSDYISQPLC